MPKQDCKYWHGCYQKNEQHLQKYNHPSREEKAEASAKVVAREAEHSPSKRKANTDAAQMADNNKRVAKAADTAAITTTTTAAIESGSDCAENDVEELRAEALSNIAGKNYTEIMQQRIRLSVKSEYEELLRTNDFIRHKFLVEMPPDFYAFWEFISDLKKPSSGSADDQSASAVGEHVLQQLDKQFQLQLVGPFEFLAGRFHGATIRQPGDYLRHWRFRYDPPEFQTIFVRRGTGIHYGYWRDTPKEKQALLVARNDSAKGCEFEFVAGNAFDAFLHFLEKDFVGSPFTAAVVAGAKKALQKYTSDKAQQLNLSKLEDLRKKRQSRVVARTFHRAGIVVPLEARTQLGYRPLIVSDAELKQMLKLFEGAETTDKTVKSVVMAKLQPVATAASIAVDECDFGTSLELGIDLFCSGRPEVHVLAQSLLVPAYTLLNRPQFCAISKAHMEQRSAKLQLSMFDLDAEDRACHL